MKLAPFDAKRKALSPEGINDDLPEDMNDDTPKEEPKAAVVNDNDSTNPQAAEDETSVLSLHGRIASRRS